VVTGGGSVICPNVPIAAAIGASGAATSLEQSSVEGLAAGEFQFAGREGPTPRDSMVVGRSLQIPRQSDEIPGILANRLPVLMDSPTAQQWADKSHGPEPLAN
jgi:hypothetical protein